MLAEQFDPSCPPQMKVRALVRGDGSARIQLYFDAMTADGHSIALMLGELDDIYSGRRTLPDEEKAVLERLKNPGPVRLICINDSLDIEDFERMKETIKKGLNELLPEKSGFER